LVEGWDVGYLGGGVDERFSLEKSLIKLEFLFCVEKSGQFR
jgi:hypothetical protein